ncbi:replication initiation protein [Kribbella turkmenica]|uniref:Replication initiation protein n=1 Tax=Kribbella turkmenica TaxID=2530375 RepID=A0A4R4WGG7_9ACTN|nr:replication initiator [Kribbella turkmenica]TDD16417.1 replication initiation protein [Kribbella turkmenica]
MTDTATHGRITLDRFPLDVVQDLAITNGVCVRPILNRVVDTETGTERIVGVSCGSTLVSKCPPCAEANRRLRMQQCREGWHRDTELDLPADDAQLEDEDQGEPEDAGTDDESTRRVRSTRRRQDAPDLPRVPMDKRTVGTTFRAPNGKTYRPSMFLTLTLDSYGATHRLPYRVKGKLVPCSCGVHHSPNSPVLSTPVNPSTYDYRRAALDALHFSKGVDRFVQNLRRCAGYKAQYFAVVEPQKRLAPHLHMAVRGTVPREIVRQVAAATYHQVWWPEHETPLYGAQTGRGLPIWDEDAERFLDPNTGALLPTWDNALDDLAANPAAQPAHVVRFGEQVDYKGIVADSETKVGKAIGYLTKYLGKAIGETYGDDPAELHPAQLDHLNRLHEHVKVLPCSPACANWLLYGITPKDATGNLVPGECDSKAHDREHLGLGGRRVLVSRQWTGKTLTDHRADRAEVIRQTLSAAGVEMDDQTALSVAQTTSDDEQPRFIWTPVRPGDEDAPTQKEVLAYSITKRIRWREQYEQAKQRARDGTGPPTDSNSATDDNDDAANAA